tara:strand:- start:14484 stop:16106 length:1623 start_codon:yes stop_codon:yes gene_type:complete
MRSLDKFIILIPAISNDVAFHNELTKKLSGTSLVQRSINIAIAFGGENENIYVITNSEEINLISQRNKVKTYYDESMQEFNLNENINLLDYIKDSSTNANFFLFISPYAPLLTSHILNKAKLEFVKSQKDILRSVRSLFSKKIHNNETELRIFNQNHQETLVEINSFKFIKKEVFKKEFQDTMTFSNFVLSEKFVEINSFHDWWICEKLLNRNRIILRIIGNKIDGMGHIYRGLTLAHEISDHEVIFVTDNKQEDAINVIQKSNYRIEIFKTTMIVNGILDLKPNLLINDILSTSKQDVLPFIDQGIRVINFEDLGEGAALANLTINELFDYPQIDGANILWGHSYFLLRDEFIGAHVNKFNKKVKKILLTFGGTDQNNLVSKTYSALKGICSEKSIFIKIVTGPGFTGYEHIKNLIKGNNMVSLTRATGVISSYMEDSQIAISSNGRTVYELAHMRIPSIIIAHHERENTHNFSNKSNGFIKLGLYKDEDSFKKLLLDSFCKLVDDKNYRFSLFQESKKLNFFKSKKNVIDILFSEFHK